MNTEADRLEKLIAQIKVQFQNALIQSWGDYHRPGKWSRKEILGHLVDSALNNIQRFIRATHEENFKLVYDQDSWVASQHYQDMPLNDVFALWALLNGQLARIFRTYPVDRLDIQIDLGKDDPMFRPVRIIMRDYIDHLIHHQQQLFSNTN